MSELELRYGDDDDQTPPTGRGEPLCVDVDGTVLATDLLFESFLGAVKVNPVVLLLVVVWLLRGGRVRLKHELAQRVKIATELLPLNLAVVEYMQREARAGRPVYLVSASDAALVERLADRFDCITGVIGSDGATNLKGSAKAEALRRQFGATGWEYVGDAEPDFAVWRCAAYVTCVSSDDRFMGRVRAEFPAAQFIVKNRPNLHTFARALRIHQWAKNLLVFLPIVLAHRVLELQPLAASFAAALAFSLCASGVYLLNDLLDLEADRAHPRKRRRPCAAGTLSLGWAMGLVPVLFLAAAAVAGVVGLGFAGVLAGYLVVTTAYSFRLKALMFLDIVTLALLYTVRLVGGGVATEIRVSQWLLGLSMFLFVSLACVKRFSELLVLRNRNETRPRGRGYLVSDLDQVAMFGTASGYCAVLVLALYVSSTEIQNLYRRPDVIWLACPLLMYWISRIWLLARRGLVHDDPLVFTLRDQVTYLVAALAGGIFLLALW